MAHHEAARRTGAAVVQSILPDVCWTPIGGVPVPVPYSIVASFELSEDTTPTVRLGGAPAFTTKSWITHVTGDEAGSGGGIVSGVNLGPCHPLTHSGSVRVNGAFAVRDASLFWMNCAGKGGTPNTIGRVVYVQVESYCSIGEDGDLQITEAPAQEPEDSMDYRRFDQAIAFTYDEMIRNATSDLVKSIALERKIAGAVPKISYIAPTALALQLSGLARLFVMFHGEVRVKNPLALTDDERAMLEQMARERLERSSWADLLRPRYSDFSPPETDPLTMMLTAKLGEVDYFTVPSGPWDHKPILDRILGLGKQHHYYFPARGGGEYEYYYDIWSNIHYGYVASAAGLDRDEVLSFANLDWIPGVGRSSPADDLSTTIGIELWREHGADMTREQLYEAIRAHLDEYQELSQTAGGVAIKLTNRE